ncbi:MAG: trypsin-like peptidase domain-containing protein [Planctomycetes bacterium]|nr:trypsin-like peptidase domain-containing protein [Planctomycetota bacterium]
MSRITIAALGLLAITAADLAAQSPSPPPSLRSPVAVDSGYLANPGDSASVVFSHRFTPASTTWLQLHFDPSFVNLPEGSFLRMTATADGGMHRLDGRSILDWGFDSALFNGNDVTLELVAAPKSSGNRVVVIAITRGLDPGVGPTSICGTVDNRVANNDVREGRLWLGCTGWMIGTDLMLTAGHCTTTGTRIIEFNVPPSTAGGSIVRASVNDQYPYTEITGLNGGVGADWRVCRVLPNSVHGQLPTQRNGNQWYQLGAVPGSTGGQNIRISGYGVGTGVLNQAQTTHVGPLSTIGATSLCYATDTTGGNSGSPVIHENTGRAIGIHTHGGCTSTGGCNSGTRIDRSDLQAAIAANGGTSATFSTYGAGCPVPPTFYELFTTANDLSGRSFLLSPNGSGGWNVSVCASNCFEAAYAGALNLGDDQLATNRALGFTMSLPGIGTTSAIDIDSNGWIGLIAGQFTASDYTETVAEFLAQSARLAVFWDDLNPATGGDVYFDTFPGKAVVTWAGVPEFGTSNLNTFQAQLFSNGNILLSYTTVTPIDGIAGYSSGAVATDPGSSDLSARVPFSTGSGGVPLAIFASANPILGTTIQLGVNNVPAGVIAGAMNIGLAQQSISLGPIGAPGCSLLTTIETFFPMPATTPSTSASVAIPNIPALSGAILNAQGAVLVPGINTLGALTSNGGRLRLGS